MASDRIVPAIQDVFLVGVLLHSARQLEVNDRSISLRELLAVYALAERSANVFVQFGPLRRTRDHYLSK